MYPLSSSISSPGRNFSKFCSPTDRRQELLDLPTDKMLLVLRSKLLILRDAAMFPLRAVPRESAILSFVLEYLQHREAARRPQAAALLACVRLHLLPLHAEAQGGLAFPADRWLPRSVLELGVRLGQAGLAARLEQWERDVKYLHTQAEPNHLYRDTCADKGEARLQVQKSVRKVYPACQAGQEGLGQRNPTWAASALREASVAHEWWTAHDHDSRFVPSSAARGTRIVAVSGACGAQKCIRKLVFCLGEVHDNHDLLPEWFHLAPQFSMQNMQQELGEYIGAMQVHLLDASFSPCTPFRWSGPLARRTGWGVRRGWAGAG